MPPGGGLRVGHVEFLAQTEHSPRFNLALIEIAPGRAGPPIHQPAEEDDAFLILDGELTFGAGDREIAAPAGTFVLVPPGVEHTFRNATDEPVRMVNVHAPAGFDLRLRD